MRRVLQPPPRVNPPRLPEYLFEPAPAVEKYSNNTVSDHITNHHHDKRNPSYPERDTSLDNYQRDKREVVSERSSFDRDVEEQMRLIEDGLRSMLQNQQSDDNEANSMMYSEQIKQPSRIAVGPASPPRLELQQVSEYNQSLSLTENDGTKSPRVAHESLRAQAESARTTQPSPFARRRAPVLENRDDVPGTGLKVGVDLKQEEQLRRAKQAEYKRQLDQQQQHRSPRVEATDRNRDMGRSEPLSAVDKRPVSEFVATDERMMKRAQQEKYRQLLNQQVALKDDEGKPSKQTNQQAEKHLPQSSQPSGNMFSQQSPRLSDWKALGFPSEYSYAKHLGLLNESTTKNNRTNHNNHNDNLNRNGNPVTKNDSHRQRSGADGGSSLDDLIRKNQEEMNLFARQKNNWNDSNQNYGREDSTSHRLEPSSHLTSPHTSVARDSPRITENHSKDKDSFQIGSQRDKDEKRKRQMEYANALQRDQQKHQSLQPQSQSQARREDDNRLNGRDVGYGEGMSDGGGVGGGGVNHQMYGYEDEMHSSGLGIRGVGVEEDRARRDREMRKDYVSARDKSDKGTFQIGSQLDKDEKRKRQMEYANALQRDQQKHQSLQPQPQSQPQQSKKEDEDLLNGRGAGYSEGMSYGGGVNHQMYGYGYGEEMYGGATGARDREREIRKDPISVGLIDGARDKSDKDSFQIGSQRDKDEKRKRQMEYANALQRDQQKHQSLQPQPQSQSQARREDDNRLNGRDVGYGEGMSYGGGVGGGGVNHQMYGESIYSPGVVGDREREMRKDTISVGGSSSNLPEHDFKDQDDKQLKKMKQREYAEALRSQMAVNSSSTPSKQRSRKTDHSAVPLPPSPSSNHLGPGWVMGPLGVPVRKTLEVGNRGVQKAFNEHVIQQVSPPKIPPTDHLYHDTYASTSAPPFPPTSPREPDIFSGLDFDEKKRKREAQQQQRRALEEQIRFNKEKVEQEKEEYEKKEQMRIEREQREIREALERQEKALKAKTKKASEENRQMFEDQMERERRKHGRGKEVLESPARNLRHNEKRDVVTDSPANQKSSQHLHSPSVTSSGGRGRQEESRHTGLDRGPMLRESLFEPSVTDVVDEEEEMYYRQRAAAPQRSDDSLRYRQHQHNPSRRQGDVEDASNMRHRQDYDDRAMKTLPHDSRFMFPSGEMVDLRGPDARNHLIPNANGELKVWPKNRQHAPIDPVRQSDGEIAADSQFIAFSSGNDRIQPADSFKRLRPPSSGRSKHGNNPNPLLASLPGTSSLVNAVAEKEYERMRSPRYPEPHHSSSHLRDTLQERLETDEEESVSHLHRPSSSSSMMRDRDLPSGRPSRPPSSNQTTSHLDRHDSSGMRSLLDMSNIANSGKRVVDDHRPLSSSRARSARQQEES